MATEEARAFSACGASEDIDPKKPCNERDIAATKATPYRCPCHLGFLPGPGCGVSESVPVVTPPGNNVSATDITEWTKLAIHATTVHRWPQHFRQSGHS